MVEVIAKLMWADQLPDLLRNVNMQQARARLRTHYMLLVLAGAAVLSLLIYWLALVQPYGLLRWQHWNQMNIQRMAVGHPYLRWYLTATFVELLAVYAVGWRAVARLEGRAAWRVVLGGAAAMSILLLFLFPFGAADIFDNIMHGRIVSVYGANPFFDVIARYSRDPIRPYVGWPRTPSAYGPLWELIAGAAALAGNRMVGASIVGNVLVFKVLVGAFYAGSLTLIAAILHTVSPERALTGTLLYAWNPIVLYETMGNGHNDIVMAFFILLAVWLMLKQRYTLAILALVAGGLIKFIPVLLIPAAGLIALRDLPGPRLVSWPRVRFLLITLAAGAAMVVLAYEPFWHGIETLGIHRRERLFTSSLPSTTYFYLMRIWGPARALSFVNKVALAWTLLFAAAMSLRAFWDRSWASFARSAFYILIFYLMFTGPWFQNWYALWPLALAVLLPPGYAARLGMLFALTTLAKPLIFEPQYLWIRPFPPDWWRELRLGPSVMAVPWAYTCWGLGDKLRGALRGVWNRKPAPVIAAPRDRRDPQ